MNKLTSLFLALAIAFGTFGFYQQHEATTLRARVAELETAAAKVQADAAVNTTQVEKLKDQTASQKAVIQQLEARNKELASTPASGANPPAGDGAAAKGGENFMKGMAKMFSDPKTRDAMRAQQAAQVNMMYSSLGKELGLAPDVTRQVLALLGDRQADIAAKSMAAMSGDMKDTAAMGKEMEGVKKAYDEQLKALLGEDGFKKLGEYDQSIGERVALDQIQRQLSASGTTLEPAQQKSLLDIMTEERKRAKVPLSGNDPVEATKMMQEEGATEKWLASQEDTNRRVLDRARSLLSADQYLAFETAQKQFLDMQKMGVQMSRQFFQKK